MKCFQFDGVLHSKTIQEVMRKAEAAGNKDCPVKIKLVAPPSVAFSPKSYAALTGMLFSLHHIQSLSLCLWKIWSFNFLFGSLLLAYFFHARLKHKASCSYL